MYAVSPLQVQVQHTAQPYSSTAWIHRRRAPSRPRTERRRLPDPGALTSAAEWCLPVNSIKGESVREDPKSDTMASRAVGTTWAHAKPSSLE